MEQTNFEQLLAANTTQSAAATKSTEVDITVLSIGNWKPTKTGLAVLMVRTDKGNFFPLASAVSNAPKDFFKPAQAKAVFTAWSATDGTQRLNMARLQFAGLPTETALMIQEMPAGTALFAKA